MSAVPVSTSQANSADAANRPHVAVVGAGPAGLIAAEILAGHGLKVTIFERMAAPARKLLMAGRGGLNLTHSEPLESFLTRFHPPAELLINALRAFPPAEVIAWAHSLGIETFVGTSGRVFPRTMKASPLLRAWLARLSNLGVELRLRHTLSGIEMNPAISKVPPSLALTFTTPAASASEHRVSVRGAVLALGGGSWPRLGTDGGWVELMRAHGVPVTALAPANAALRVGWSDHIRTRFAGTPLKRIVLSIAGEHFPGELILTRGGLEGGPAYAANRLVRDAKARDPGTAVTATLDLRPDLSVEDLVSRLDRPRAKQSLATFFRKSAGLAPLAIALLHEPNAKETCAAGEPWRAAQASPESLARRIKALPLVVDGIGSLDRAISSAGGMSFAGLDDHFMVKALPGVFASGEMLDWEAPTGGYLLQASFSTGVAAARGLLQRLGLPFEAPQHRPQGATHAPPQPTSRQP